MNKHGATYMQGWQADEVRKAEGSAGTKPSIPLRSFQANAPKTDNYWRWYWVAIIFGFVALIAVWQFT